MNKSENLIMEKNATASPSFSQSPESNKAGSASATLAKFAIDPNQIADPIIRQAMIILFNIVESLRAENAKLREENQRLRDEINRLKGEQGKPNIKPQNRTGDISSEKERSSREPKNENKRGTKLDKISIHRTEVCGVNRADLPTDAVFKGYETVVIQDLVIKPDNIEFKKEIYYSPSLNKNYMGTLPMGYEGEFGPGIRSLVLSLKYVCMMSESNILEFLKEHGVIISPATISRMLTKNLEIFHQEKADLFTAGLESTPYQQTDDTSARVRGKQYYTHIFCNEIYTAFFTREHKDRLTILDILRQFKIRIFLFNEESDRLFKVWRIPDNLIGKLGGVPRGNFFSEEEVDLILDGLFPDPEKHLLHRIRIKEATAIAGYHQEFENPIVQILICDDAPQFKLLTEELGLCWIHDGRHYKKLDPVIPYHIQLLETFRGRYWDFYARLIDFKGHPTEKLASDLSREFDILFSTKTGYDELDKRIEKTKGKKELLLLVLRHPEIELHNNRTELEARVRARRRDISLHTMTVEGTQACDTMTSIVRTAKKLGVSAFKYIFDRVSRSFHLPSLAQLIRARGANPTKGRCAEA
jgi:hypothetical protein